MQALETIFTEAGLLKDDWFINIDDFEQEGLLSEIVGKSIYKIKEKKTNNIYAAKIYSKYNETKLLQILKTGSKLHFISILQVKGLSPISFNHVKHPVLIMEYASNGNLSDLLEQEKYQKAKCHFTPIKKLINIYGIALGMKYMHSQNIIHRHLETSSILLDDSYYPKISNFGFSKKVSEISLSNESNIFVPPSFVAPEIWTHKEYSKSSDVYAFSMIVYEILTNKKPQQKNIHLTKIINDVVQKGYRPKLTKSIPKCFKNLIQSCWSNDPKKRPTFSEIVHQLATNTEFIPEKIDKTEYLNYILINQQNNFENSRLNIEDISDYKKIKDIDQYLNSEINLIIKKKTNELYIAKVSSRIIDFFSSSYSTLFWQNEINNGI